VLYSQQILKAGKPAQPLSWETGMDYIRARLKQKVVFKLILRKIKLLNREIKYY
jgi:hypothetical protein